MIANLLTIAGVSVSLFAIFVRYLMRIWPAEDVDFGKLTFHLEVLQYGGVALAVLASVAVARKAASKAARIRISLLAVAVITLAGLSIYRGDPEVNRNVNVAPNFSSNYRFSKDWISNHTELWRRTLEHLKGKPNIQALEIGSYEGRSSLWFLENILTDPRSKITCVDIWAGTYEKTFDENIKLYGRPGKVVKIKNRSDVALRQLTAESFDFIYVDGSHMAKDVLFDAVLGWQLLKAGGIMIFDDYNWTGPRSWLIRNHTPKLAIDAFQKVMEPYSELIHSEYQVILRKKLPEDIDLETFTPVRSLITNIQELLG